MVTHKTDEFSHVCPKTGLPDIGTLEVEFVPQDLVVELKSLKYYLLEFRNRGISYEDLTWEICAFLFEVLKPLRMTVTYYTQPRGGIRSKVTASLHAK